MTIAQFLSLLIFPVGGLGVGLLMLYVTRKDRQHGNHKPRHSH